MKVFILVDSEDIVRCIASEECNLHPEKIAVGMRMFYVDYKGTVGDKYDLETDTWISRPENYPKPNVEELYEEKIQDRMRQIAIDELIKEGKLPPEFQNKKKDK